MRLRTSVMPLLFVFAAACSSSSNGAASSPTGVVDAGVDAGSYDDAVNAASWAAIPGAPKVTGGAKQDDIYFVDANLGFAVSGPASTIYKTVDSGATWTTSKNSPGTYFRSVSFVDANHGFASNLGVMDGAGITDSNVLYETKDSGGTWNPVTAITGTMPTGICNQTMIDPQHLVAVGRVTGPSFMLLSSDGGASWASTDLNSQLAMLIDAHFFSTSEGLLTGQDKNGKGTVLRTTDGGKTFSTVFTSTTANSLTWKISFASPQVGYVAVQDEGGATATSQGTFAKTTDGGQTWSELPLPTKFYPSIGIGFITENIGWVGADDATAPVYKTADGGQTWAVEPNLKNPINRFRFVDKNTAFAIGGTIYKMTIDTTNGR